MTTMQWASVPSDTNGVESLNKCSIDHSKRSKLESPPGVHIQAGQEDNFSVGFHSHFNARRLILAGNEQVGKTKPGLKRCF